MDCPRFPRTGGTSRGARGEEDAYARAANQRAQEAIPVMPQPPLATLLLASISATAAIAQEPREARWLHPLLEPLSIGHSGPFARLADGRLATMDSQGLWSSGDDGTSWTGPQPTPPGADLGYVGHVGQFLQTRSGALVMVYLNMGDYTWSWNDEEGRPNEGCKLEVFAARSPDAGVTWSTPERLLDGYNADFTGFIQTRAGDLVVTLEHLVEDPARWVVCSFVSSDDGVTWRRSNIVDLGGYGHHDGATEPAVVELSDGRLLMLIRTCLDRLWEAYSEDDGRTWRTIRPSPLDASSAPCHLIRLADGRLAVVWNRLNPEGREWPKTKGAGPTSEFPASWHREELSLAFSSDDGATWTKPVVIAREKGGQVAYPYLFEAHPGELWVTTRYTWDADGKPAPPVIARLDVERFLKETGGD